MITREVFFGPSIWIEAMLRTDKKLSIKTSYNTSCNSNWQFDRCVLASVFFYQYLWVWRALIIEIHIAIWSIDRHGSIRSFRLGVPSQQRSAFGSILGCYRQFSRNFKSWFLSVIVECKRDIGHAQGGICIFQNDIYGLKILSDLFDI